MFGSSAEWKALSAFRSEIEQRGYAVETTGRKAMNSGLDRYSGSGVVISIESDGAFWMVEIQPAGAEHRDGLHVWSVCLGEPVTIQGAPLKEQLAYLKRHLAEIEAACGPYRLSTTTECLDAARRATQLSGFVTAQSRDIAAPRLKG